MKPLQPGFGKRALFQQALHELMKDKTVVVIAHRLSTIMEMTASWCWKAGRVTAVRDAPTSY